MLVLIASFLKSSLNVFHFDANVHWVKSCESFNRTNTNKTTLKARVGANIAALVKWLVVKVMMKNL